MKKMLAVVMIFATIVGASSCTKKYKEEVARLNSQKDSLIALSIEKDTFTMTYVRAFNAIQSNLDSIKAKERLINEITSGKIENKAQLEDNINKDIDAIYELLVRNREIVDNLRGQLRGSSNKNKDLEKMVANLTLQIEAKDAEINQLKLELANKNLTISDLEASLAEMAAKNKDRQATIDAQIKALNQVWYIIGSKKNLQEMKIITKEGGIVGIGKSRKVSENFDKSLFTQADLRELSSLSLMSKKAKVLTVHPAGSYEIVGYKSADSLVIKHADDFWSASKYLVIMVD
ncbi:MAG: hypothetical protein KKD74_10605 [Bacteroidetes bacterium]|nr:hypothetical protein [Bacteroidota bacterium]